MSAFQTIGVLGGMGPEATVLLQQRLIAAVEAKDDADHIPLLIDMNPQVPSRIAHLIEGQGKDPTETLVNMAKRLEQAGAKALIMPCNTAHNYAQAISKAVNIPFLDMIDATLIPLKSVAESGSKIGILASPAVEKTRLFEARFEKVGFQTLWPKSQSEQLEAIREIKAHGATKQACDQLARASKELHQNGALVQVIACSEFSLLRDKFESDAQIIDSLDALVGAAVKFALTK